MPSKGISRVATGEAGLRKKLSYVKIQFEISKKLL